MSTKNKLKKMFTTYWEFLALKAACEINLFDAIELGAKTLYQIQFLLNLHPRTLQFLLGFLEREEYIKKENKTLLLTEKGKLLTEKHPESLKQACILWGNEHLTAWQNLAYTLKTGKPAFEKIFGKPFFDFIAEHPEKLKNYHQAMETYARDDYQNLPELFDFAKYQTIADLGGGTGTLLKILARKFPDKEFILFDLPEVVKLATNLPKNIRTFGGSFFKKIPFKADIIILSRVLHDWNDEKTKKILERAKKALKPQGKILIMEILQNQIHAHLLSLNMMLITRSFERTLEEYEKLLENVDMKIENQIPINELQTLLIVKP